MQNTCISDNGDGTALLFSAQHGTYGISACSQKYTIETTLKDLIAEINQKSKELGFENHNIYECKHKII